MQWWRPRPQPIKYRTIWSLSESGWIQQWHQLFLGGQILSYPLPGFSSAHLGDLRLRLRVGCWRVSDTFPPPRPLSRTYSPLCTPRLSSGPLHPDPLPTLWLPCTSTSARPAPRVARVQKPIWEPRPRGRPEDSRRRPSGECWSPYLAMRQLRHSWKVSSWAILDSRRYVLKANITLGKT